ncbi:unnamed protein product [Tilletia laevis]|uniref:Uncharacterized protein n=3 Tax=Tilletia TaxID=13289 RepID=A0A9N8LAX9_9BASI|nr:unnamed protein product [Tilletia laevis]CAD6947915.1 unnamed protein product [Tilletia caries]
MFGVLLVDEVKRCSRIGIFDLGSGRTSRDGANRSGRVVVSVPEISFVVRSLVLAPARSGSGSSDGKGKNSKPPSSSPSHPWSSPAFFHSSATVLGPLLLGLIYDAPLSSILESEVQRAVSNIGYSGLVLLLSPVTLVFRSLVIDLLALVMRHAPRSHHALIALIMLVGRRPLIALNVLNSFSQRPPRLVQCPTSRRPPRTATGNGRQAPAERFKKRTILTTKLTVDHEPKNSPAWKHCAAANACKGHQDVSHRNTMNCMNWYWWGILWTSPSLNDRKCPEHYKKIGISCLAYNACVAEMSPWEKDPGAACRDWCFEGAKVKVKCP